MKLNAKIYHTHTTEYVARLHRIVWQQLENGNLKVALRQMDEKGFYTWCAKDVRQQIRWVRLFDAHNNNEKCVAPLTMMKEERGKPVVTHSQSIDFNSDFICIIRVLFYGKCRNPWVDGMGRSRIRFIPLKCDISFAGETNKFSISAYDCRPIADAIVFLFTFFGILLLNCLHLL